MPKYPIVKLETLADQKILFFELYKRGKTYAEQVGAKYGWAQYLQDSGNDRSAVLFYPWIALRTSKGFTAYGIGGIKDTIHTNSIKHFLSYTDKHFKP